jgi:hypothetical protein
MRRSIHLEFAQGPTALRRKLLGHGGGRLSWLALPILVMALAAGGSAWWRIWTLDRELEALTGQMPTPNRSTPAAAGVGSLSAQQRAEWVQLTRQLNTPWSALLDALEAATPQDVALVSIEPDARQGIVRLQAEAKTLQTLLDYGQVLRTSGPFEDLILRKHDTNDQDGTRPIRLTLELRFRRPGTVNLGAAKERSS